MNSGELVIPHCIGLGDASFAQIGGDFVSVSARRIAISSAAAAFRYEAFANLNGDVAIDVDFAARASGILLPDASWRAARSTPNTSWRIVPRGGGDEETNGREMSVEHRLRSRAALELSGSSAVLAYLKLFDDDRLLLFRDFDARLP